jgi:hypothetical protein
MIEAAGVQCRASPPLITDRGHAASGTVRLQSMPMGQRGGGRSYVELIIGELKANLAEIMHLSLGQLFDREDRRAVEQPDQPMPLAVELLEGLGHPELAAARIGGESGLCVHGKELGVFCVP